MSSYYDEYIKKYQTLSLREKYEILFPSEYSKSYSKSLKFVRNEFFNLDQLGFDRFLYLYERKYGPGPTQYVKKIYSSWRSGMTKMVRKTEERILICVPPVLNKEKQFKLLAIQIPEIIRQQKKGFKDLEMCTSNLVEVYNKAAQNVVKRQYNLDWFVSEVFPPEELEEFLNVIKYTMLDCLKQSYQSVCKDLNQLDNYIPKTSGAVQISYNISLFSRNLKFDVFPLPNFHALKLPMIEPLFVTKFQYYYKKFLLDHAIKQYKEEAIGQVNNQIAISDVEAVAAQLKKIGNDQEYDTSLDIKGNGGSIHLHLQKKNLGRLQNEIVIGYFKLLLIICAVCVGGYWVLEQELYAILFIGGFFLLSFLVATWDNIKDLEREVRKYERKRRTQFKET